MTPHTRVLLDALHRDLFCGYQFLARLPRSAARTRALAELDRLHATLATLLTNRTVPEHFETDLALLDQQLMSTLTQLNVDLARFAPTPPLHRQGRARVALSVA